MFGDEKWCNFKDFHFFPKFQWRDLGSKISAVGVHHSFQIQATSTLNVQQNFEMETDFSNFSALCVNDGKLVEKNKGI